MIFTDTSEHGLESHIVNWLTQHNHYEEGSNDDYNREYAVDETRLLRFLKDTQKEECEKYGLLSSEHKRLQFFSRINAEISKRGIIDVLRNGIKSYPSSFVMFYSTPSENNAKAKELHSKNIFSVTRQLRYSQAKRECAVDMCIFINGLPVITIELKNSLTGQTTKDAVLQYEHRNSKEILFSFKRCIVHFAVDDMSVKFCTRLADEDSLFLPFDKGFNDGAGNPPNPDGIMTDYLWKDILTKEKLSLIIDNYVCLVKDKDKKTESQIFPRYHQLDAVTKLLADVMKNGVGQRYLIQHSAGSGKSNSIAWLAHRLAGLEESGDHMFDSVLVVTDRRILDRQIRDTVKNFTQVRNTVTHAEHSRDLMEAITEGKRIIITTVEKFPYISQVIGHEHRGRRFAVIIDEAHSGQNGRNSAEMSRALFEGCEDYEDGINMLMESRKLLKNASYFAFTATPKNKTLEIFGTPYQEDGETKYRPFHVYTMKQAIQEEFILDVLQSYTPVKSFYRMMKIAEDDPKFDKRRAMKELRNFAEGSKITIDKKAAMMVQHFHEQVIARGKIGGRARAMIVTSSIHSCIEYYFSVNKCLTDRKSPYKALIAFSGVNNDFGRELTSAGLNEFPDNQIPQKFREEPYRLLVVADMFQTGFDEPLLHTMYIDKMLTDIKAVQTLSRLNRKCREKHDTFVLDFANDEGVIEKAFSRYYRTVILSGETDPNKLYDLEAAVKECGVFSDNEVEELVKLYLDGAVRERLDSVLDKYAVIYGNLDMESQIKFKGSAKAFVRTYNFLGSVLPYCNAEWERLCIFLTLLLPKLPSLGNDNFLTGLSESVDLESYRIEAKETMSLALNDKDFEVDPIPSATPRSIADTPKDLLSSILSEFNSMFGNIGWKDADNVQEQIRRLPEMVSRDKKYLNAMKNSDEQGIRLEMERALNAVINSLISDSMELYGQFQGNKSFREWLSDIVLKATYNKNMNMASQ